MAAGLAALALAGIVLANERSGLLALVASFFTVVVAMRGIGRRALTAVAVVIVVGFAVYLGASSRSARAWLTQ